MNDHTSNDVPWPMWASQPRDRDELATLLGISTRSLRRAVKQGHAELVQGEDYHTPLYRLRDCAWSRKHLSKWAARGHEVAATSRPHGRHGQGWHMAVNPGQSVDEAHCVRLKGRGQVEARSRPMAQDVAATSGRNLSTIEHQVEQLAKHVEALRSELEDARRDVREDAQRLEAEHAAMRQQLVALIALLAVLVEAHRQREAAAGLNPFVRLILSLWRWLKTRLDGLRS